jgi:tetratricopeptide (TPR) repeat protein
MKHKLFILSLLLSFIALPVFAQKKPTKEETEKAANLFRAAEAFFAAEEYERALDTYSEAFRITQYPDLLFNMAQCNRFLKNYEQAAIEYKAYLAAVPQSPIRKDVEPWIKEMEEKAAANPKPPEVPKKIEPNPPIDPVVVVPVSAVSQPVSPTEEKPTKAHLGLPIALGATGVAFLAGALGVKFAIEQDSFNNSLRQKSRFAMATTADISFIASGVTLFIALKKNKKMTAAAELSTGAP